MRDERKAQREAAEILEKSEAEGEMPAGGASDEDLGVEEGA